MDNMACKLHLSVSTNYNVGIKVSDLSAFSTSLYGLYFHRLCVAFSHAT